MTKSPAITEPRGLTLNVKGIGLTNEQFLHLCRDNPELRLELTAQRELVIKAPAGSKTSWRNSILVQRLLNWTEKDGGGVAFESSAGFVLPSGANRSPDAAWVRRDRWEALTVEEQESFAPVCPDFVAEIRSPSDSLAALKEKMSEYLENGARLGWLIDPAARRVYVYRSGEPEDCVDNPTTLRGDPVLPGFVFDVAEIF